MEDALDLLRATPVAQLVLRAVVALGPVLGLGTVSFTGRTVLPVLWALVTVLGLAAAARPDSLVLAGADLVVLGWWSVGLDGALPAMAVVGAAALLASHLAATVASYGPSRLGVDPGVAGRWGVRGVLLLVPSVAVLVVARGLGDVDGPTLLWPLAVLGVIVVVVTASLALRRTAAGS